MGPVPPKRRIIFWSGAWRVTIQRATLMDLSPGKEMEVVFSLPVGEKTAGSGTMDIFWSGTGETGFPSAFGASVKSAEASRLISEEAEGLKGLADGLVFTGIVKTVDERQEMGKLPVAGGGPEGIGDFIGLVGMVTDAHGKISVAVEQVVITEAYRIEPVVKKSLGAQPQAVM